VAQSAQRIPYGRNRPEPLLFLSSSSSVVLTRLSGLQFQTHILPRKSGSAGNLTQTSGSVARNCDH
jgi:hypothetical protein